MSCPEASCAAWGSRRRWCTGPNSCCWTSRPCGLDPVQRGVFRELLAELSTSVQFVVSTHQTEDLGEVYDTVVVVDRGRPVFQGTASAFLATAPAGTPRERCAESAYRGLVRGEV